MHSPPPSAQLVRKKFGSADASRAQALHDITPESSLVFTLFPPSPSAVTSAQVDCPPPARLPTSAHTVMPLSKAQPEQASIPFTPVHFIGPTKPILKPSPAQTPVRVASPTPESAGGKHAHFPPPGQEPTARYSGVDYDRSPIVVQTNVCALPERGCPGKTYFEDDRGTPWFALVSLLTFTDALTFCYLFLSCHICWLSQPPVSSHRRPLHQ